MDENNEFILQIYKRKVYGKGFLIPVVIFIVLILLVLFVAEPATSDDVSAKYFITIFFSVFVILFGYSFFDINKSMKNALYVKENGRRYNGRVIGARKRIERHNDKRRVYTDLLVEFDTGFESKYIISKSFPYDIDLQEGFGLIDYITKKQISENEKINFSQYISKGYTTFDNHDNLGRVFKYEGSKVKNYLGKELTCSVFELDGKYVIDDYVGYDEGKIKRKNLTIVIVLIIFFVMFGITFYLSINNM